MSTTDRVGAGIGRALPPLDAGTIAPPGIAIGQSLRAALAGLRAYKLRAALTLLGLVVGVAAVLSVVTLSQISRDYVEAQWSHVGANLLTVAYNPVQKTSKADMIAHSSLTVADADALRSLPHVVAVSPVEYDGLPLVAGAIASRAWVVEAASPAVQSLQNLTVPNGAFFTDQDEASAAAVAVIGPEVATHFYPGGNPVGQTLRIGTVDFQVVGVLSQTGGTTGDDTTDATIVPYSTYQQRLSGHNPIQILVQVDQIANIPTVTTAVTQALDGQHHIAYSQPNDFAVWYNSASTDPEVQAMSLVGLVFGLVAAIALLIGAFGIASTMFLAVRQRRSEIGLRLAVGARPADVLRQFVAESAALSLVGGIVGTLVGCGVALAFYLSFRDALLGHWFRAAVQAHPLPSPATILAALILSLLVGVGFGYLPARQAARLDPVEALREA